MFHEIQRIPVDWQAIELPRVPSEPALKITEEIKKELRQKSFNHWDFTENQLVYLIKFMFDDLQLTTKFKLNNLLDFIFHVKHFYYSNVFYHNFIHCFCVTHLMYCFLYSLSHKFEDIEVLVLIISALSHDLDHPGLNNIFQINSSSELALIYNDISVLENHHCALAFEIIKHCGLLNGMDKNSFTILRSGIISCILATGRIPLIYI